MLYAVRRRFCCFFQLYICGSPCRVASNKKEISPQSLFTFCVETEADEVSHCSVLDQTKELKAYFPMFKVIRVTNVKACGQTGREIWKEKARGEGVKEVDP